MSRKNTGTFEYGGYHFTPYRQFQKGEGDFFALSRRLETDPEMGLSSYRERQKFPYVYEDFYAAATDKTCDIFRCEENGRIYVPGARELFIYHEPQQIQKQSVKAALTKPPSRAENRADGEKKHSGPEL